jgi:hypothetical protein
MNKIKLIEVLNKCNGRLVKTSMRLDEAGLQNESKALEARTKNFNQVIENLQKKALDEWNSSELLDKVMSLNADIEKRLVEMEKKQKVAENVVKVIGLVDQVILKIKA